MTLFSVRVSPNLSTSPPTHQHFVATDLSENRLTFLYIHKLANPSSAQPTVARMQNTPETIEPLANRLIKLMRPPEPEEGIPMNM